MSSTMKQQQQEKLKAEKEAAAKVRRGEMLKTLRHAFTLGTPGGRVVQGLRIDGRVKLTLFHPDGRTESRTLDDVKHARSVGESWLKG